MLENLKKLFAPVASIDADQARKYMTDHPEGSYTLLDVRQPREYEEAHIPGARLVPLPSLSEAYQQLDQGNPIIVY